jgi:hypothetical protein
MLAASRWRDGYLRLASAQLASGGNLRDTTAVSGVLWRRCAGSAEPPVATAALGAPRALPRGHVVRTLRLRAGVLDAVRQLLPVAAAKALPVKSSRVCRALHPVRLLGTRLGRFSKLYCCHLHHSRPYNNANPQLKKTLITPAVGG